MSVQKCRIIAVLLAAFILLGGMSLAAAEDTSPGVSILRSLGNYTVIFNDYNGVQLAKYTGIAFGIPAEDLAPADPVRAGYTFEGWFPDVTDYTIMKNEVFIAQYRANEIFKITVNYTYGDGRQAAPVRVETLETGTAFSFDSPAVVGYTPDQSRVEGTLTADTVVTVVYAPNTDTPYTVEHYLEDLDGTYTLDSTLHLTATTDTTVTVAPAAYAGFTCTTGSVNVLVAADGSALVKMYYNRNTYAITFESAGGSFVEPIVGKYGSSVTAPADPDRMGYIFTAWDAVVPAAMPAGNLKLTAQWIPGTAGFTIVYWQENANDAGYTYVKTDTGTGLTEETIVLPPEKISNSLAPFSPYFSYGTYDPAVIIKGDGTSVVNVYYTRNLYTISFDLNDASFTSKAAMQIGGNEYITATGQYSFTSKYDSIIYSLWPILSNITSNPVKDGIPYSFYGWDPPHDVIMFTSRRFTLSADLIFDTTNGSTTTYPAYWVKNTHTVQLHYYVESLIQEAGGGRISWGPDLNGNTRYYEDSVYSQDATCGGNYWNAKVISGCTNVGKDGTCAFPVSHIEPYEANFYYTRNVYDISFYNYNYNAKTDHFKYGADINVPGTADYVPPKPAELAEGFTFGGWYTTPGCIAGTEFVWAGSIMPSNNMILYARWDPPIRAVTFRIIQTDGSLTTYKVEYVDYGNTIGRPSDPDPTLPGYTFDGWYYVGTMTPFSFDSTRIYKDTILEAKWREREDIEYIVYYRHISTLADLLAPKTVIGQRMNATASEAAAQISGYLPDVSSKAIVLGASGNEIIFLYSPIEGVQYTVRYLYYLTNDPLYPAETFDAETEDTMDRVTVHAREITGYYPDAYQKRIWLTSNSANNIITFIYYATDTAPYTVRHYLQTLMPDGSAEYVEQTADTQTIVGPIGLSVAALPNDYGANYIYQSALGRSSGYISRDPFLRLDLYYNLKTYRVVYNEGANGDLDQQDADGNVVNPTCLYGSATPAEPDVYPEEHYEFTGWLPAVQPTVTGDALYVAQYSIKAYRVVYNEGTNGDLDQQDADGNVVHPICFYGSATPAAPAVYPEEHYEFTGWQPAVQPTVTGDALYVAQYSIKAYRVVYNEGTNGDLDQQDADGNVVHPTCFYGSATPAAPAVYPEDHYEFTGWLPAVQPMVTGDALYVAQYSPIVYRVVYNEGTNGDLDQQDADGNVVHPACLYGSATPDAPAVYPEEHYEFTGWLPVVQPTVTGDALYVAQYSPIAYRVVYNEGTNGDLDQQDADGNVLHPACLYGSATPDAPDVYPEYGYVFTGWLPAVQPTVTGDALYVAQYSPIAYRVVYNEGTNGDLDQQDADGNVVHPACLYGSATPDAPDVYPEDGYVFTGWLPAVQPTVTGDALYVAQYSPYARYSVEYYYAESPDDPYILNPDYTFVSPGLYPVGTMSPAGFMDRSENGRYDLARVENNPVLITAVDGDNVIRVYYRFSGNVPLAGGSAGGVGDTYE